MSRATLVFVLFTAFAATAQTVSLTASSTTPAVGQSVRYTITVTGSTSTPDKVVLMWGQPGGPASQWAVVTNPLVNGVTTIDVTFATVGTFPFFAQVQYWGFGDFDSNVVTTSVVLPTTTSLAATPVVSPTVVTGESVTYLAVVSTPQTTTLGGQVVFTDNGLEFARVAVPTTLSTTRSVTATRAFSATGARTIVASFTGSPGAAASSASLTTTASTPPPVSPQPVVRLEYDANGSPTKKQVDPTGLNRTTSYLSDELGRRFRETAPDVGITQFGYTGSDRVEWVVDPLNSPTVYPGNGFGDAHLLSQDTGTSANLFDAEGFLQWTLDARGTWCGTSLDPWKRPAARFCTAGVELQARTFTYDETSADFVFSDPSFGAGFTGKAYTAGQLTTATSLAATTKYAYDPLGRIASKTQVVQPASGANSSAVTLTMKQSFDPAGEVLSTTFPSGKRAVFTRSNGRLTEVGVAPNATTAPTRILGNVRTSNGAVRFTWVLSTGLLSDERWVDVHGRPVRYTLGPLTRTLAYAADGALASASHSANGAAFNEVYTSDANRRLKSVTRGGVTTSYTYDANGNRTTMTVGASSQTFTMAPNSNRLLQTSASSFAPARIFTFNADGSVASDGRFSATYDLFGRLATMTVAGTTTTYSYDAFGRRVRKAAAGQVTLFLWSDSDQLIGEYTSTGAPIAEYVWDDDRLLAVLTPSGTFFVASDHLETPRVVFDTSGNVRWRWMSEPFGTALPETNPSGLGAFVFNLRGAGQYFDAESGLHHNVHREYDPWTGRYLESDVTGISAGTNTYAYALNRPHELMDPDGHMAFLAPFAVRAVAVAAAAYGRVLMTASTPAAQLLKNTAIGVAGAETGFQGPTKAVEGVRSAIAAQACASLRNYKPHSQPWTSWRPIPSRTGKEALRQVHGDPMLHRGVAPHSPHFDSAKRGIAEAPLQQGFWQAEGYYSYWTSDYSYAVDFAGPKGVVMSIDPRGIESVFQSTFTGRSFGEHRAWGTLFADRVTRMP